MNTAVDARRSGGTGGDARRSDGTGADATRSAASTAELARTALRHAGRLARAETRAGLAELEPKLRDAGMGVALFGVAGVTVCYGIATLLASVTLLLALVLPRWAAALVVTVALFAAATVVALVGRARLRRTRPLIPDRTIGSIRSDLRVIGTAAQRPHGVAAGMPRGPVDTALPSKAVPPPKVAPLQAAPPAIPVTRVGAAPADAPAVARISDSVRRHRAWWAVVGAGMVAAGSAVAGLRRRRARRTPPAPAVRAWRAVVGRLGR